MTQILGEDLARVVGNTMKFVNPKSIYLPGELLFNLTPTHLECYACDDYIALTDNAVVSNASGAGATFVLSLENAKDLEKFARENKKSDLSISIEKLRREKSEVAFALNTVDRVIYPTGEFRESNWDLVDMMLFDDFPKAPFWELDFNPERFTKFSQLKHDKEAHMHWELLQLENTPLVRFDIGNTITGVIRPLNLEDDSNPDT